MFISEYSKGSSSSSTDDYKYDVFLSFHGADTRYGFTHILHKALQNVNICTFFDDEEMETGGDLKPELESAIKSSRVSIVVLSKTYASSSWCLNELVQIIDQLRASKQIVIPVFYHVEPTHVRKQEDTYGEAMAAHQQKIGAEPDAKKRRQLTEKMDRWIKALKEVADLKGVAVEGRPEAEFIKEIVDDIYRRLHIFSRIPLPQLFGMDDSINSVTSWLKDESSHTADIYTIWGIGGIGKTSLAKHVYRLHSHKFDASSFVGDISRRCNSFNGLLDLQKQLLDDILKRSSIQVHEVSLYIPMIENALASKKVFLVLDGIDNLDQLNALLGSKCIQAGSKIIITTRNTWLIESCELFKRTAKPKHTNHLLKGLNKTASRLLLCFHAFMSNDPKTGYEEVLEKLVMYCEGHPLALEVLGGYLYKRDVAYWEGLLETLKKENGSPVNNILRISFDSLPSENDKDLFKHIACFFVGVDKYFTEAILKACDINTSFGFTNLLDRCLLTIEENNILMMHQLLQEMGRYLVREESPNKPWKRSRLWRHEESFEVLKQQKGTENVLGLSLDMRMLEKEKLCGSIELKTDALSNMVNLILLQLNDVQMIGSYNNFPEKIRWLCMHGFRLKSIPSDLPMDNLVALDLSYSNIESFDIFCSNPQRSQKRQKLIGSCSKEKGLLGSLKFLNLSFCKKLCSLDGFDGLPALEWLVVTNCLGLLKICESIQKCVELVHVDLSYCIKLGKLPRTIAMLKKLKTLLLEGCSLVGSQVEVMDMDTLVNSIGINTGTSSSTIVNSIPSDFKFFTDLPISLVTLSLGNNNLATESFPVDFSCLSALKDLCLDDNPIIFIPNCVRTLPRLEVLHMAGCSMLKSVEHPPPRLRFLNLFSIEGWLQKVVFDPEMSPLRLGMLGQQIVIPCDIEGIVKIQRMTDVEEKLLDSLGWTNPDFLYEKCMGMFFAEIKPEESKNKMYMCYEFGIFTTHYMGKAQPNWITERSEGPSISFTIPSSPFNLRGLNLCFVEIVQDLFPTGVTESCTSPIIKINNTTKNLIWIYETSLSTFQVDGECLILLSHWMFGMNEMEAGDHVTITGKLNIGLTKECGVSFVYDDEKTDEEQEEDVLGYYKSWNHIIGGDLSGFQTTTGEYILYFEGYERDGVACADSLHEFVTEGAIYKEKQMWFRALSQKKSGRVGHTLEEEANGLVKKRKNTIVGDYSSGISFKSENRGANVIEESSHGCKANLPPFKLSVLQYLDCLLKGPNGEQLFSFPLEKMRDLDDIRQIASSDEEDDAEVDYMKSSKPNSSGTPKSKKKKTANDVIQELDEPLSEGDDGNLRSRSRPRRRLMDVEQILEFPPYVEKAVRIDKGKAINATEGASEQHSWGGKVAHDIVEMQPGYLNKMRTLEAEHYEFDDRFSQAEVEWAKAESQLVYSEALREEAHLKIFSLEASNSKYASRLEVLESEKKQLGEKIAMLEAANAEGEAQLKVATEGLTMCRADLEWVLAKGLPRSFDKVLESEDFSRASRRLQKACMNYGIERGCRLMRDRFQLVVADAELPNYNPDTEGEVKEAYSSFAQTDFVATTGFADLSVDALRAFCLSSSDDESG